MKRIAVVIAMLATLLVVLPASAASISMISLSPAKISGGAYSTASVYLASAAPTGGQVVTLSSSDPSTSEVVNFVIDLSIMSSAGAQGS